MPDVILLPDKAGRDAATNAIAVDGSVWNELTEAMEEMGSVDVRMIMEDAVYDAVEGAVYGPVFARFRLGDFR